ncbi:30S ribosomal protein S17 [Candidatus Saccharibacteria bacterium]|nr:30S ribosomal protein S17 [Candidatus Saccharibacteria bacterium]
MAKTMIGVVTSNTNPKTIVVTVTSHKTHPVYKKRYISSKKFMAHDETNQAKIGDKVVISEVRPVSASKRFKLDKVLEHASIRHEEGEES